MTEINLDTINIADFVKDIRIFIESSLCNACGLCGEICPFGLPQKSSSG
ncbi:unnamed protein product, partial [marine sediment metagenome]